MVLKSLRQQVYEYLFEQLRQRALEQGSFLDLNEIAERLGVSRTPLRDALIYLEVEGYVEFLPRRGIRVKPLTIEEIRNLYQIIGTLEGAALLEAAITFSGGDLRFLRKATETYGQQVERGSYEGCLAENFKFHDFFLDRCGNPTMAGQVRAFKRRLYDWPRHTKLAWEWERRNLEEHQQILDLLEAGDLVGASEFLRAVHWSFPVQESFIEPFYKDDEG
jgi:DNA-binding GntR family transcriptional regulator